MALKSTEVRYFRGSNCNSDHYLAAASVWGKPSVSKGGTRKY